MRQPGKMIGGRLYVHRDYATERIPPETVLKAMKAAVAAGYSTEGYTAIRYDIVDKAVAFQWSPDFDTAREPRVGNTLVIHKDGRVRLTPPSHKDPLIWHHKWMWVGDDYTGFDVEESKRWSNTWRPLATPADKRRIGRLSGWRAFLEKAVVRRLERA